MAQPSARVSTFTKIHSSCYGSVTCDDMVEMGAREAQISNRKSERRYMWRLLPFGHDPLTLKHLVRDASECVQ